MTMHSRLLIRISLLFLVVAFGETVFAQSPDASAFSYQIKTWTTEDGLPQNTVHSIIQTRDGYLWLTTVDGLVRYDGVRFTILNKSNSPGLASNRLTCLFEDADGSLWIGTEDAGVMRYSHGQFKTFNTGDGLPGNQVYRIQADGLGGLRFHARGGYAYWRGNQLLRDPENLRPDHTKKFFTPSGAHWTFDATGLCRFKDGVTTFYPSLIESKHLRYATFYEDRQENLWFGAFGSAAFKLKDGVITRYGKKDGLPQTRLNNFLEDRQGTIWIGTDGGLVHLQEGRSTLYTVENGLSDTQINDLLEDREGNLWVGTNAGGLNRLSRKFMRSYSTESGLHDPRVYPILQDRSGAIWAGAFGGLARFADGRFASFVQGAPPFSFAVQALFDDRAGRLWVGSFEGVSQFRNGKFFVESMVPNVPVNAIHEDRDGYLWFGTDRGLLKCKDGSCVNYNTKDGLPGADIKVIVEDRRGDLWIGTYGGIARFSNGKFSPYTERDGLTGNHVRYIYEDAEGTFWIGTYDSGLSRFRDGRFTNYKVKDGLYNEGVFQILEDTHGRFWIGCNKGIYRVSKQQLNDFAEGRISSIICSAYNQQDGMGNTECNGGRQPGGLRAPDGTLLFPTLGGVVVVDPEAAPPNPLPPPVMIESALLDGRSVDFRNEVRVEPDQKYLEISYTGLSFIKSEQMRFKYKLVGRDGNWIDAGTRRTAYYSYLPPGQYTFTVTASNSDGVWNSAGASLRIVVVPPFWRRWWFITLVTLSFAGMIGLAVRQRLRKLEHARAAQERFSHQLLASQEHERQRIAAELHDSLGQSLLIIKNRAFLALGGLGNVDATRDQIEEISTSSAQAIEEVRAIAYNLRPYQLDRFGLTATLEAICEQAELSSGIRFVTDVENIDGLFTKEAEINLYRIVQESINNILKHSQATEASLAIERADGVVRLRIADNGRGFQMTASIVEKANGDKPKPGGFGLIGIAERVRILKGAYAMEAAPGRGTTINITLTALES